MAVKCGVNDHYIVHHGSSSLILFAATDHGSKESAQYVATHTICGILVFVVLQILSECNGLLWELVWGPASDTG